MVDFPLIISEHLLLRLPEKDEAKEMLDFQLDNRIYFRRWSPERSDRFYTLPFWENTIQQYKIAFNNDKAVPFAMFDRSSRKLIGIVHFSNIVRGVSQSCNLGYQIDQAFEGKGMMYEALTLLIPYMFTTLNLHRIEANYMPANIRSGRLLKRLEFKVFGEEDDSLRIDGNWEKHIRASLINNDWQPGNG